MHAGFVESSPYGPSTNIDMTMLPVLDQSLLVQFLCTALQSAVEDTIWQERRRDWWPQKLPSPMGEARHAGGHEKQKGKQKLSASMIDKEDPRGDVDLDHGPPPKLSGQAQGEADTSSRHTARPSGFEPIIVTLGPKNSRDAIHVTSRYVGMC